MSVYRDIAEVADFMRLFGSSHYDIVDTFMTMSPDPYHSAGFVALYTGLKEEEVINIFMESDNFIKIDKFVWTTEEKIKSCNELDKFEKLV